MYINWAVTWMYNTIILEPHQNIFNELRQTNWIFKTLLHMHKINILYFKILSESITWSSDPSVYTVYVIILYQWHSRVLISYFTSFNRLNFHYLLDSTMVHSKGTLSKFSCLLSNYFTWVPCLFSTHKNSLEWYSTDYIKLPADDRNMVSNEMLIVTCITCCFVVCQKIACSLLCFCCNWRQLHSNSQYLCKKLSVNLLIVSSYIFIIIQSMMKWDWRNKGSLNVHVSEQKIYICPWDMRCPRMLIVQTDGQWSKKCKKNKRLPSRQQIVTMTYVFMEKVWVQEYIWSTIVHSKCDGIFPVRTDVLRDVQMDGHGVKLYVPHGEGIKNLTWIILIVSGSLWLFGEW